MRLLLKKRGWSIATKIFFVLLDIICINLSSFLVFMIRFNMQWAEIPFENFYAVLDTMIINTIGTLVIFALFRLYTSMWRFASIKELMYIIQASFASVIFNLLVYVVLERSIFWSYFFFYFVGIFLFTCTSRFAYRFVRLVYRGSVHTPYMRNTMIIGAGEACNVVMKELELSTRLDAKVCCIIDDDPQKINKYIHGVKVVGNRESILENASKYQINEIIVAIPGVSRRTQQEILNICQKVENCDLKIIPGVYQLVKGEVSVSKLRNVELEDLLGREPVAIKTEAVGRYVSGKVVLVTGGGGSIGSELCRQIVANGVRKLIIFDIYENNAYDIQQELKVRYPNLDLVVLIGSVRNSRRLNYVFAQYRPHIVYHAAAHKHVPLMEDSPNEAIKNNVFGTYKTAVIADQYHVEKFVLISTDKAVNPTNIMGASKRIGEMIIQLFNNRSKTEFVAVRFGNVLGSNGSVIPLFKKQIESGGPVTVTHPDIIRYFMTIPEAVSLVLQAGASGKGGEIFVLDMGEPVKIVNLAKNLIRLSGYVLDTDIEIKYIGLRAGEKLYEELLMEEEGLEKTSNSKIFIGKPIEFDEEELLQDLDVLYAGIIGEKSDVKQVISRIVPEYQSNEVGTKSEEQVRDDWKREYAESDETLAGRR
ncbi:MAG: polysaccharide biosynthesis protein [Lachnospiraceae bacterium]|nr:polysaccharide biosynthesis protein [Lachnospiraceae bacterium]